MKKIISLILMIAVMINIISIPNLISNAGSIQTTITDLGYIDAWTNSSGDWITSKDHNGNTVRPIPKYAGGGSISYTFKIPVPSEFIGKITDVKSVEYNDSTSKYDDAIKEEHFNIQSSYGFGDSYVMFTVTIDYLESNYLDGKGEDIKDYQNQAPLVQGRRFYVPTKITFEYIDESVVMDTLTIKYQDVDTGSSVKVSETVNMTPEEYNYYDAPGIFNHEFQYWTYDGGTQNTNPTAEIYSDGDGSSHELIFYYQIIDDSGTVEPPPKPSTDMPDIDIWVVPRDSDPSTPSSSIYEGEHIQIRADVEDGYDYRWRFYSEGSNQGSDGIIDNTFLAEYPDYDARAVQRADYIDFVWDETLQSYLEDEVTEEDEVSFTVKQIKPPVVEISGDFTDTNLNVLHLETPYNIESISYDINEPSEEHPEGFGVINEGWQFINNETGEILLQGNGLLNESSFILSRDIFETEKYYTFRTIASNDFKPIRKTLHDVSIYIENLPPQVDLEIISEDGQAPTFAKEEFNLNVNAGDKDGIIADVKVEVLNEYDELHYLGKSDLMPLLNEYYEGNYRYVSDIPNVVNFSVITTDDKGAETILNINDNIIRPSVYADILVVNEEDIQKKTYRYIEYDFTNSYENAPFGINHTYNIIKYKKDGGEWLDVPNNQDFENNDIRIHFPNYPIKNIMGVYYKTSGTHNFSLEVFDNKGFDSDEIIKSISIINDNEPVINYNIESFNHRITENDIVENSNKSNAITEANIGKGYIKIVDNSNSSDGDILREKIFYLKYDKGNDGIDNDIEYITTITEDPSGYASTQEIILDAETNHNITVKDLNNVIVTFLTKPDGMGDYFIKEKVKERISQLPPIASPLYNELLLHELQVTSNYSNILIDNIKPSITFEIGSDKEINIIVHYDDYISSAMQNKINELINNLENRGLKVKLIKYENKY